MKVRRVYALFLNQEKLLLQLRSMLCDVRFENMKNDKSMNVLRGKKKEKIARWKLHKRQTT